MPFSETEWHLLTELIRSRFGLEFEDSRRGFLEARLEPRLRALGLESYGDYYLHLVQGARRGDEVRELQSLVTNNETYFFREPQALEAVAAEVAARASLPGRLAPVRVLSAGCSSGEEPYSLAIALAEAALGPPGVAWTVEGCDLSPARLAQAREALYEGGSLRACDAAQLQRYFTREEGGHRLRPSHRRAVHFFEANLAEPAGPLGAGGYDVILCRNLLIYFGEQAFQTAVERLRRSLRLDGVLLVGNAESLIGRRDDFEAVVRPRAVVYRQRGQA